MLKMLRKLLRTPKRILGHSVFSGRILSFHEGSPPEHYRVSKAVKDDDYLDIYNDPYPPFFR